MNGNRTTQDGSLTAAGEWEAWGPFRAGGNDPLDYFRIGPVGSDEMLCDVAGKDKADFLVGVLNERERLKIRLRLCASAAGHPDAAEGCRRVIGIVQETLDA